MVRTGRLLNVCMQEGRIPKEWRMGLIVPIWKKTGDVHNPGKYRGITLLSQALTLLERGLDARIRRRVEGVFGEEQQVFMKGRSRNSRRDVGPETDGIKRDWRYRAVWLWGSSIWRKPLT